MFENFFKRHDSTNRKIYVFLIVTAIAFVFFFFILGILASFFSFSLVTWILVILIISMGIGYKTTQKYEEKILKPLKQDQLRKEDRSDKSSEVRVDTIKPETKKVYIMMLGETGVGKSSLIARYEYQKGEFPSSLEETTEQKEIFVVNENMTFIDTPGNVPMAAKIYMRKNIKNRDLGIVLVYDINNLTSFAKIIVKWVKVLSSLYEEYEKSVPFPPITLIGNNPTPVRLEDYISEERGKKLAKELGNRFETTVNFYQTGFEATIGEIVPIFDNLKWQVLHPPALILEEKKGAPSYLEGTELEKLVQKKGIKGIVGFFDTSGQLVEEKKAKQILLHIAYRSTSIEEQARQLVVLRKYLEASKNEFLLILDKILGEIKESREFRIEYKIAFLCFSFRLADMSLEKQGEEIAKEWGKLQEFEERETNSSALGPRSL